MKYRIALLSGDGAGPALAKYAEQLLAALGDRYDFAVCVTILPFGKSAYEDTGSAMPDSTKDEILAADAALLAAVDASDIPGTTPVGLLRKQLGLFADVRPIRSRPGRWCLRPDLDMIVIRELTQGFLSDRNLAQGSGEWMSDEDTAFSLRVITYSASHRIADHAFAFARRHGRSKVTALHKASIFQLTCGTFLRACRDAAAAYPDIAYAEEVVDNAANGLIAHPERYDVILTTNLFGDLISDEMAALVSSMVPSGNYGPDARVYLPVSHSPCYEEVKTDSYDPMPALLSLVLLLEELGEAAAAAALDGAVFRAMITPAPATSEQLAAILSDITHSEVLSP